jgi:hypothetical protein
MAWQAYRGSSQHEFYAFMKQFLKAESKLVETTSLIIASKEKMEEEEMLVRRKLVAYFLEGYAPNSLELCFRLSALLRLMTPPKMAHRLLLLLGAPIVEGADGAPGWLIFSTCCSHSY